jgi:Nucleotidyl transferase AbiEii toxin, Type IV TA system
LPLWLQQLGFTFQLKGGTSLSKGHQIINRFSEDIDILIEPPPDRDVKTGRHQNKPAQIQTGKDFYHWLAKTIKVDGITNVDRDTTFDDVPNYRSAGIRLNYDSVTETMEGLKEGVLLEVGFDRVAPNTPKDISSWVHDYAADKVDIIDNRAKAVPCCDAGYTFVLRREASDGLD